MRQLPCVQSREGLLASFLSTNEQRISRVDLPPIRSVGPKSSHASGRCPSSPFFIPFLCHSLVSQTREEIKLSEESIVHVNFHDYFRAHIFRGRVGALSNFSLGPAGAFSNGFGLFLQNVLWLCLFERQRTHQPCHKSTY